MKKLKTKYIFIVLLIVSGLTFGCKKGLNPEYFSTLTAENFPETRDDYQNLVFSTYGPLESKWDYSNGDVWGGYTFHCMEQYGLVFYNDVSSDLVAVYNNGWGGDWLNGSNGNFTYLINNPSPNSHFSKVRFVSRITQIIDLVSKAPSGVINDSTRNAMLAEARMSRGWIMWYLLYYFGPVPVIMDASKLGTSAEWDLTRPTRGQFIDWVEADLKFAADNLPRSWPESYYGRYTKGLAYTVLMRLYMNEHRWQDAINMGDTIKTLGYSLVSDYSGLFTPSTQRNNETIFAIPVSDKSQGSSSDYNFNPIQYYIYPDWYQTDVFPSGGWSPNQAYYEARWGFVDSFDSTDKRKMFITDFTDKYGRNWDRTNMNGAIVAKFKVESNANTTFNGNDIILARYADILLMSAEALNEANSGPTTEAVDDMNEVRTRAGLSDLPSEDLTNQEAFRNAILRERGWELYFEGLRRYDLMRMNKWQEALTGAGKALGPSPLLPIPQYAIDAGKGTISQNEGY
jgi:hypothetical protein